VAKTKIPPKSRFRGLRLDPEIVDLIVELNKGDYWLTDDNRWLCSRCYPKPKGSNGQ